MTEQHFVKVRDVMTADLEIIDGLSSVEDAILKMKGHDFDALIVDRRDASDEYGVITVQDIARSVIEPDRSPNRVNVYEVMKKPVLTVHANMNIRYAIRLLERFNESRALVIDQNTAVGIVTISDMVFRYMDHHHLDTRENPAD